MNKQPIETACDADLRLSHTALERAAQRARTLAAQTGTVLIISRNGVIERISPQPAAAVESVQEPDAPYGERP